MLLEVYVIIIIVVVGARAWCMMRAGGAIKSKLDISAWSVFHPWVSGVAESVWFCVLLVHQCRCSRLGCEGSNKVALLWRMQPCCRVAVLPCMCVCVCVCMCVCVCVCVCVCLCLVVAGSPFYRDIFRHSPLSPLVKRDRRGQGRKIQRHEIVNKRRDGFDY